MCSEKIQSANLSKLISGISIYPLLYILQVSQLSVPDTPDNVSYRSDDDDLLYDTPKVGLVFLYSVLATFLCFPIGALALKNVYQVSLLVSV